MSELLHLFLIFARIGGFTFGGGYAMLPIIQEEIVKRLQWATEEEVLDYYAIGQCTPGIIAVNTATFIGYKRRGIPGAIVATAGTITPSVIIITIIAAFFRQFRDIAVVNHAFGGIRVAVVALIFTAVIKMWKSSIRDVTGLFIFAISFGAVAFVKISPIVAIILSGAAGVFMLRIRTEAK